MTSLYLKDGSTLNSRKRPSRCSFNYPCKRMNCTNCIERRRRYFVVSGVLFSESRKLDTHLIISWRWRDHITWKDYSGKKFVTELDQWPKLLNRSTVLSKTMSGIKAKPYIRVLAIGEKGCPHIHFLTTKAVAKKITKIYKKYWFDQADLKIDRVYDHRGLLGYFFDKNFLPTVNHPNKPKGIRLITASRPMPCGFPTNKAYRSLKEQANDESGMDSKINGNGHESCLHGAPN